jgi:hypothetical protein
VAQLRRGRLTIPNAGATSREQGRRRRGRHPLPASPSPPRLTSVAGVRNSRRRGSWSRSRHGAFFGEERLVELTEHAAAAHISAPETLHRLAVAVLEPQRGQLQDDATLLLTEWSPSGYLRMLPTLSLSNTSETTAPAIARSASASLQFAWIGGRLGHYEAVARLISCCGRSTSSATPPLQPQAAKMPGWKG